jgi:dihydroxyacetone kinase
MTLEQATAHVLARVSAAEDDLARLDAVAGDGDHGRTMVRGLKAAVRALPPEGPLGERLIAVGSAFADDSGGAAGALYGALVTRVGRSLRDGATVDEAFQAGLDRVKRLSEAAVGDKTMIDALEPFGAVLTTSLAAGQPLAEAWRQAADEATQAAAATASLIARKGRAAALGERSLGSPDAGATSAAIILNAVGECLAGQPIPTSEGGEPSA